MAGPEDSGAPGPSKLLDYDTVFTNAKAGMEGVDAEHVKRVVYEASKGTAHHVNEQRKQAAVDERIARMKSAVDALSAAQLAAHAAAMQAHLAELEAGRDLSRTWLHVDMDAFYAAVEERDRPELVGKPFAVGGEAMISTASYAARRFGVRSAMPGFIARKLCPQLIFVRHDFTKYMAASEATRMVFREFDPDFEAGSLDEAYLDVTDYCSQHGVDGEEVAALIRQRVQAGTRLTCSVGIGPNRMLAKICSDRNKPNGQFRLEASRQAVMAFMAHLQLRKVPGVGKMTQRMLAAFGMATCGDLLEPSHRGVLWGVFTPTSREWLARVALGLGDTQHPRGPGPGEVGRKGMSCERTFRPLDKRPELEAKLREVAEHLAEDMAREGLRARSLMIKVKLANFEVKTRNLALTHHISTAEELYAAGQRLLAAALPASIRLLGLRVANFFEPGRRERGQLSLEEAMKRRGQQQEQQQQQQEQEEWDVAAAEEGDGGWGSCAGAGQGEDGEAEWDGGEPLELTLRDWQPPAQPTGGQPQRQPASGSAQGGSGSGPPALCPKNREASPPALACAPSPTAAGFGQGAAAAPGAAATPGVGAAAGMAPGTAAAAAGAGQPLAAGGSGSRPAHIAQTSVDVNLQQTAGRAAQAAGPGEQQLPGHQQQQVQRVPAPPVPTWACPACTFENPRNNFWCQMCSTNRHGRAPLCGAGASGAAAGGNISKPASSASSRAGPSTSSRVGGKRGRKSLAAAAGSVPSILRFVSRQASPPAPGQPMQQQQQQHMQRHQQGAGPEQQAGGGQLMPRAEGWVASGAGRVGAAGGPGPCGGAEAEASSAGPADRPGTSKAAAGEEEEEEEDPLGDWGEWVEGECSDDGELLPGEDWLECQFCRNWVRGSRIQAHEDKHVAEKLQRKEEELGEIFAGKRPVGSSERLGGKQATLTAMAKRLKR